MLVGVALFVAVVAWRRSRTDGRVAQRSGTAPAGGAAAVGVLDGTPWAGALGDRATLVQFSSAFCAPCRATRVVLADVAAEADGVVHLEIDAEQHLDVVRALKVLRTPTTLVLDRDGVERGRATGAPSRDQVKHSLSLIK